jgi:hypothetical protein
MVRGGDLVKIGFTAGDVAKRIANLQTGSPVPLTILRVVVGDERVERALHSRFAPHRQRGEWFTFSDEMLGDVGADDEPVWKRHLAFRRIATAIVTETDMRPHADAFRRLLDMPA